MIQEKLKKNSFISKDLDVISFLKSIDFDGNSTNGIIINEKVKLKIKNLLEEGLISTDISNRNNIELIIKELSSIKKFKGKLHKNIELKIKEHLSNKTFYFKAVDKNNKDQIIQVFIDQNITKWKTNLEGNVNNITISNIKLIIDKLHIFKNEKIEEIWTVVIDNNNKYISLSYLDFNLNLYFNKKDIKENILNNKFLKFTLPEVYFSDIFYKKDDNNYNYYYNKYLFKEKNIFDKEKFIFMENDTFLAEENDKSDYLYIFENDKWEKSINNSNKNFTFLENKKIINFNDNYTLRKDKVVDLSADTILTSTNNSILMPKNSQKIYITKKYLKDIFQIYEEDDFYNSLKQLIEYQCGENYFKDISKYNNYRIEGVSFACRQHNQVSGFFSWCYQRYENN